MGNIKQKGLHFLHININSLLPKTDELKCIGNKAKAAIIGITESKLDHTITDFKANLPGYNILRRDRNRNGDGAACDIRKDFCLIQELGIVLKSETRVTSYEFKSTSYRTESTSCKIEITSWQIKSTS